MLRRTDETWHDDGTRFPSSFGHPELTVVETKRPSSDRFLRPLERFGVEMQRRDHVTIVQPHGELDLATVETLRSTLDAAVAETSLTALDGMEITARLVLDLRGLSFMDSTGLHLLAELDQRAKREGFQLSLLAPGAPADRAIRLSGLDHVLPFVAPDDDAADQRIH